MASTSCWVMPAFSMLRSTAARNIFRSARSKVLSPNISSERGRSTYSPTMPSHSFGPATVAAATIFGRFSKNTVCPRCIKTALCGNFRDYSLYAPAGFMRYRSKTAQKKPGRARHPGCLKYAIHMRKNIQFWLNILKNSRHAKETGCPLGKAMPTERAGSCGSVLISNRVLSSPNSRRTYSLGTHAMPTPFLAS